MAKKDYVPIRDGNLYAWLQNYITQLPTLKEAVNLSDEEIKSQIEKSKLLLEKIDANTSAQATAQSARAAFNEQKKISMLSIRRMIKNIKTRESYTEGIGALLGAIGAKQDTNYINFKPKLKAFQIPQGIQINWNKKNTDGIQIFVERNNGEGYILAGFDSKPPFIDTTPLPIGVASAIWKYYGVYVINDELVGNTSDIVSIAVIK